MNAPGLCTCPCGWNAGGRLRVWDWYDEIYPPIPRPRHTLAVTTDDGPDDPSFCPECDEELDPELMQPRQEVTQ